MLAADIFVGGYFFVLFWCGGGSLCCALIAGSGAGRYMGLERCGPTLN